MELMTVEEFKTYIAGYKFTRKIKKVQLHHTYSPSYKNFNGSNHIKLQQNMRNYHVNTNGWNDIGQHFTIFPDGMIVTGRPLSKNPAGIYGANSGAICIECLGNFDFGGDVMNDSQKDAIVATVKVLIDKCGLDVYNDVVYHAWYGLDGRFLGDYYKGSSSKTCPGNNFFGGNSLTAYIDNLLPLIENYGKPEKAMVESGNDIDYALKWKYGITFDSEENEKEFIKLLDEERQKKSKLYWVFHKLANK